MMKYWKHYIYTLPVLLLMASTGHTTEVNLQAVQASQIETQDAQLKININAQQPLAPGAYTFELVVVDDSGNQSQPTRARVVVRDNTAPTAVLTAPQAVDIGKPITLDASRSTDIGGKVVSYIWRLVK